MVKSLPETGAIVLYVACVETWSRFPASAPQVAVAGQAICVTPVLDGQPQNWLAVVLIVKVGHSRHSSPPTKFLLNRRHTQWRIGRPSGWHVADPSGER